MSNGLKLGLVIQAILDRKPLSLAQQADIKNSKGGSYNPSDMKSALVSVLKLDHMGNINELIKLYKRLPKSQPLDSSTAEYLELPKTPEIAKARLAEKESLRGTSLASKEWRMNHLYKIINKEHKKVTFTRNVAQEYVAHKLKEHPRLVILKSRQRGISTDAVLDALDSCMTNANKIRGLQADSLDASNALMEKAKLAYRALPDSLKPEIIYSNNSVLEFSNGSKIRISTSFRGATLSALHVSELGKISLNKEKAAELKSGTLPALPMNAETQIVLESTSEGAGNMLYDIYTESEENYQPGNYGTFCPVFIGWVGIVETEHGQSYLIYKDSRDGSFGRASEIPEEYRISTADADCWLYDADTYIPKELNDMMVGLQETLDYKFSGEQVEWAVQAYKTLGSDLTEFKREYPALASQAFSASGEGLILANSFMDAKLDPTIDIDTRYPVYASADLGVGDTAAVLLFQYYDNRIYIIDEMFGTGQPIGVYTQWVINNKVDIWFLPHDANNRNVSTAQKVITHIRQAGFSDYKVLKRTADQWADISRVRIMMPRIIFGDVPSLIEAVKSYRKVWSTQTGTYLDKALHDDASNYCDSLRYCVSGVLDVLSR